ncbi:hypothetical protein ACFLW2_03290 [Chloroflexota bacterium]
MKVAKNYAKVAVIIVVLLACTITVRGLVTGDSPGQQVDELMGQLNLVQPALAAEGDNAFPSDEAGISAYVQVSGTPNLDTVATIFDHVEDVSENHIIGTVPISDFGGDVSVHLYADVNGWIVAYLLRTEPSSLMMQWTGADTNNPNVTSIKTTLEDAIVECCDTIGAGYGSLGYYNFKYPDADGMALFARAKATPGSNYAYVKVPVSYTLYEASYYHYACNLYSSSYASRMGYTSYLKLDGTEVSSLTRTALYGEAFRHTGLYSTTLFTTDILHEIEIYYTPYNTSYEYGSAGVAVALIYKTS